MCHAQVSKARPHLRPLPRRRPRQLLVLEANEISKHPVTMDPQFSLPAYMQPWPKEVYEQLMEVWIPQRCTISNAKTKCVCSRVLRCWAICALF